MLNRYFLPFLLALFLSACGNPPPEKTILGTWVQATPSSTTQAGIEATTSGTVLTFEKDGDVSLRRQLDLRGAGLPAEGVSVDVDLSGQWTLRDGALYQTLETAIVTPRMDAPAARKVAQQLQDQAGKMAESRKAIIALDRTQLILQDKETEVTDVYRRK